MMAIIILNGCAFYSVGVYHKVKKGETLSYIAKAYEVNIEKIIEYNHISNRDRIRVGRYIFIPGRKRKLEIKTEKKYNVTSIESISFIWPVKGKVVGYFGKHKKRRLLGIEIACKEGDLVRASASGKVIFNGSKIRGYGNMLIIKHKNNYSSIYAHNKQNIVKKNDIVKQGDVIAKTGKTGLVDSPILYFEIRHKNKPINPLFYLPR